MTDDGRPYEEQCSGVHGAPNDAIGAPADDRAVGWHGGHPKRAPPKCASRPNAQSDSCRLARDAEWLRGEQVAREGANAAIEAMLNSSGNTGVITELGPACEGSVAGMS
jgi:hypothetical protein